MRGRVAEYKVTDGWWRHGFIICTDGRIAHFDHYGIAEGFEIGPGEQVEFDLAKSSHWEQGKLTADLDEAGNIAVNVRPVQ